jgi:inner membrane protein
MSPVTHFFSGWVLANCAKLNRKDRALVTLACVIPDVDGLGIIPEILTRNSSHPLLWFSLYHHSLHTLAFALIVTAAASVLATRKWATGVLVLLSFHIHLFEDLLGSRGPDGDQWPIPLPGAVFHGDAAHVERSVGPQRMAQRGHHGHSSADHILAGMAARILTA